MPLVNVKLIEGVFTPTQKQEMIRKLRVYRGAEHPHGAQQPEVLTIAE